MGVFLLRPAATDYPSIRVAEDAPATLGRHVDNSTLLPDVSVSRRHAVLEVRAGALVVRDLGSRNGTFINGNQVREARLEDGDTLQVGNVRYTVVAESAEPASDQQIVKRFSAEGASFPTSGSHLAATSLKVALEEGPASDGARLATILSIANALTGCTSEVQLGERVLEELRHIIQFDRAALLLLDDANRLNPVVSYPPETGPVVSRYVSTTIVRETLRQGEAVLTSDARTDPRFQQAASITEFAVLSAVCLPLQTAAGQLGALYFDSQTMPGYYSEGDLEYLGAFAAQAALALSHMQLQRRIRDKAVVQEKFSRFFSPATVSAILEEQAPLELGGAEQMVTVLFSDIRGYTALSERLPPSQIAELLNDYFPQMVEIVFAHDGTLEKFIGDALLAVWGAPLPHADDAARAIKAAMGMQEAVVRLNAWWAQVARPYDIEIGIGIHTGLALAGNIGSKQYLQYATIGDTTNTASRLCTAAGGGQILVSAAAAAKAADSGIAFGSETKIALKGKREPFAVRPVLGTAQTSGDPTVKASGG